jgi:hypothetical protein
LGWGFVVKVEVCGDCFTAPSFTQSDLNDSRPKIVRFEIWPLGQKAGMILLGALGLR